jgi:hypothetical protein
MTDEASPDRPRLSARAARRLAPGAVEYLEGLERRVARLEETNARLQRELRENQRMQRRLAELTDVVQELLVPIAQRDEDRIAEVLVEYQQTL